MALLLLAVVALGGCSSVPNWANPMEWFGDDQPAATPAPATGGQPVSATDERFPSLSRVPPRPVEQTASAQRGQAIGSLSADRANAQYTDQELRGRPASSNQLPPAPLPPSTPLPSAQAAAVAPAPQLQGGSVPAGAVREIAAARGEGAARTTSTSVPQPMATAAPAPVTYTAPAPDAGQNMGNVYASLLQASAATSLPAGMAQMQQQMPAAAPSSGLPASAPMAGSAAGTPGAVGSFGAVRPGAMAFGNAELLAVVRFGNGETKLDGRDRVLVRQAAEFQRGIGGKQVLYLVAYAAPGEIRSGNSQAAYALAQQRGAVVAAELQAQRVDARAIQAEARTEASPAYQQASRRVDENSRRVEIYIVK